MIDLRLPQLEPTDLRGIPVPDREAGVARWYIPEFLPRDPESKGILFLDEIEKASISVKNAALQLVLDRRIGSYSLPDGWAIVCAGNRDEDGCFSTPLGSALANRMIHLEVEPDLATWQEWAKANEVIDDIIGFLEFRSELLHKMLAGENAFPSPRTWVMASKLIKSGVPEKRQRALIVASVGKGAAHEFQVWRDIYRNVDVRAILEGKLPEISEEDRSSWYATTMAVVSHVKKKAGVKGHEEGIAGFIDALTPELKVVFIRQLTRQSLEKLVEHKAFDKVRKSIFEIATEI